MATMAISLIYVIKEFCYPCTAKGVIGRVLKFAGYVYQYKSLPGNIFTFSFLPSWSHPQLWITDLERPLTFFMIMILLSQRTEFPFVGKILRLQSSRLD